MKKILSLCLVLTVLLSCVGCGKTETTNNDSVNTTESTTETTTESTTESTTETTTETTTEKKTETTTNKKVENTTTKTETTTKKPNKTETTTKKPVTTTKPSSPDKVPEDEAREGLYKYYGGKEGYEAHLKEVANYKCNRCGKHDCPSLEYGKDLLGNPDWPSIWPEKCPAIINETAKCPHCGKTLVADDRWLTEPNKYCDGACHLNFS